MGYSVWFLFFLLQVEAQESVNWSAVKEGKIEFQIDRIRPGADYSLKLIDLITDQVVAEIDNFEKGIIPTLLSSIWLPEGEEFVGRYELYRDGHRIENVGRVEPIDLLGQEVRFAIARIDYREKLISWSPGQSSIARVTAYLDTGLKVASLQPWQFSAPGKHRIDWDFKDESGGMSYYGDSRLSVRVQYIPLPYEYVVVGSPVFERYAKHPLFDDVKLRDEKYDFYIEIGDQGKGSNELPVLKAGDLVRVRLSNDTLSKINQRRYEVLFFLNGEFLHEEVEGLNPVTYLMPNVPGGSGESVLEVNVKDLDGGWGIRVIKFEYKESGPNAP